MRMVMALHAPSPANNSSWFLWPSFSFQVYPGNVLNTYLFKLVDHLNTTVNRGWYTKNGCDARVVDQLAQQELETTMTEDIHLVGWRLLP